MLAESLHENLNRMQPSAGPQSLTHQDGPWTVQIDLAKVDSIGCSVDRIHISQSGNDKPIDLKTWGNQIERDTTGLLEPLKLLELDSERQKGILRSQTPSRIGDDAHYYEVAIHGSGQATVERFKANTKAGTARQQIPFALTHEAIARVAGAIGRDNNQTVDLPHVGS